MSFFCPLEMNKYRVSLFGDYGDMNNGILIVRDRGLHIQFSNGMDWDHVSVSRKKRMPSYEDMCWVKNLFWSTDMCVMELHVPKKDHLNYHQFCLHLWRPQKETIPRPPQMMIGPKAKRKDKTI